MVSWSERPVERIVTAQPADADSAWRERPYLRGPGIRQRLLPDWCKELWNPETEPDRSLAPTTKFIKQGTAHYGESYAMAVIHGTVAPIRWASIEGGQVVPGTAPDWLARGGGYETLYECFRLLDQDPHPSARGIYQYGEHIMDEVLRWGGGNGNVARALRDLRRELIGSLTGEGKKIAQPDLLALPRNGGQLVAIECKRLSKDRISRAQVNGFALLQNSGVRCEVWWLADPANVVRLPSSRARGLDLLPDPAIGNLCVPRIRVVSHPDWGTLRTEALRASRPHAGQVPARATSA